MRVNIKRLAGGLVSLAAASALLVAGASLVVSLDAQGRDFRLVQAARNKDRDALRALLSQRVDVNTRQPDGATALHWAAHWDDVEMVDLLIQAGARVDAANDHGMTALTLACENGNAAIIAHLLASGANPNAARPTGETPLMIAARTGKTDSVKVLLARGADVHAREAGAGQTALMWAAAQGHAEVVRLLMERGASVEERSKAGFTPLLFAARKADLNTTRALLDAGANVNAAAGDGTTALLIATIRGATTYAEFLLSQGADPNLGAGFTPLHWAAGTWDTDLTGATAGITAEDTEWTTLGGLRGPARLAFVKVLLAHRADPNARAQRNPQFGAGGAANLAGGTPFLMAAKAGDVPVMRALLAAGADPLLTTNAGVTPMMMAAGFTSVPGITRVAESDALEAVKLCLELGGDVNAASKLGDTALHGAASRGADTIVQFLAEKEANLGAKNKQGWSPLTIADGIFVAGGIQRWPTTAPLLRKLGAAENPLDCQAPGNDDTAACAFLPANR